jgi:hypothetical protein
LAEHGSDRLRDEPPENIGRSTRRERNDHSDRTARILVFGSHACGKGDSEDAAGHDSDEPASGAENGHDILNDLETP